MSIVEKTIEYRGIPGVPGYFAGSDGSIWSACYTGCHGNFKKTLSRRVSRIHPSGHLMLKIYGKTMAVHRLILLAFVGPCPAGMEACHNDGNPGNNAVENLRWDTRSANVFDSYRSNKRRKRTKVSGETICKIRTKQGQSIRSIAREVGISPGVVRRVLSRFAAGP